MLRPLRPRGEVMRGEERRGEEMRSKGDGWIFVSICKCKYFIFKTRIYTFYAFDGDYAPSCVQ